MNPTQWELPGSEEVVRLHAIVANVLGPPKAGCVEAALGAAINAALYGAEIDGEDEADLICIAAHALVYIARNQCFVDGNKRAAWSTLVRIFDMNGMRIEAAEEDAATLTNGVAEKKSEVSDIMRWLAAPGRIVATSS